MSVLTLFDYGPSANCLKVRILLRQLGLEYERVAVDIFAGESQRAEYLLLNPAGSPFLPADPVERAHVHQWLFFEQNLLEPNAGSARFWHLTGRESQQPGAFAQRLQAGKDALAILDRGLTGQEFLV